MSIKFSRIAEEVAPNSPQIITDSGHCFQGLNLLGHAQLVDLDIGSECGGQGRCGKDRVRIAPEDRIDFNPPTGVERRHLKPEAIEAGWRLACQCFPSRDGLDLTVEYGPLT